MHFLDVGVRQFRAAGFRRCCPGCGDSTPGDDALLAAMTPVLSMGCTAVFDCNDVKGFLLNKLLQRALKDVDDD